MTVDEKNLLDQLKSNNHLAFKTLVETHHQKVYQICYGFLRNNEDAQDTTQDVFIEIFKSVHFFRGDSSLSTWIYRIAVNRSLNLIKKNKTKQLLYSIDQFFHHKQIEPQTDNTPFSELEKKEQAKIIQKEIDKLPKNQKTAFTLHKYNDYSYAQIAEIMNLSLSSIESLIHRAKIKLQENLKKQKI